MHWIDQSRGWKLEDNLEQLFCSEIRANLLSGKCQVRDGIRCSRDLYFQDFYQGKNALFSQMLNRSIECAERSALKSMKISTDFNSREGQSVKCSQDTFPWPERPLNEKIAKRLWKKYFLTDPEEK